MLTFVSLTAAAYTGAGVASRGAAWAPARHAAAFATGVIPSIATVPDGVLSRNVHGRPLVDQRSRPRRNRKSEAVRRMVRETTLSPSNFIYPLFIHDEKENIEIKSMPGCERARPADPKPARVRRAGAERGRLQHSHPRMA